MRLSRVWFFWVLREVSRSHGVCNLSVSLIKHNLSLTSLYALSFTESRSAWARAIRTVSILLSDCRHVAERCCFARKTKIRLYLTDGALALSRTKLIFVKRIAVPFAYSVEHKIVLCSPPVVALNEKEEGGEKRDKSNADRKKRSSKVRCRVLLCSLLISCCCVCVWGVRWSSVSGNYWILRHREPMRERLSRRCVNKITDIPFSKKGGGICLIHKSSKCVMTDENSFFWRPIDRVPGLHVVWKDRSDCEPFQNTRKRV